MITIVWIRRQSIRVVSEEEVMCWVDVHFMLKWIVRASLIVWVEVTNEHTFSHISYLLRSSRNFCILESSHQYISYVYFHWQSAFSFVFKAFERFIPSYHFPLASSFCRNFVFSRISLKILAVFCGWFRFRSRFFQMFSNIILNVFYRCHPLFCWCESSNFSKLFTL